MDDDALTASMPASARDAVDYAADMETLEKMRAYMELTAEELLSYAGIYDALSEDGIVVAAGPAAMIDADSDRFDLIIDWYVK